MGITVTDDLENNFVSLESLSDFSSENNTDNYQENHSTTSKEDDISSNEEEFIKISMEDVVSLEDKVEPSENKSECESVEGFEDNFVDFNQPSPVENSGEPTFVSVLYPAPLSRSNTKEQIIVNDVETAAPKVALIKHVPKPTPRKSLEAKKETNLKTVSKKRTNSKQLDPVKRAELLSNLQDIMSQAKQLRKTCVVRIWVRASLWMAPLPASSKVLKAFMMVSSGSVPEILSPNIAKKTWKLTGPLPSASISSAVL